jgi:hypothetical protein
MEANYLFCFMWLLGYHTVSLAAGPAHLCSESEAWFEPYSCENMTIMLAFVNTEFAFYCSSSNSAVLQSSHLKGQSIVSQAFI